MVKNTCISGNTGDTDTFSGFFRPSKDAFSKFSGDFQKTYTCKGVQARASLATTFRYYRCFMQNVLGGF
jgi:hypothetical protein